MKTTKKELIKSVYARLYTCLGRRPTMFELEEYSREHSLENNVLWTITRDKVKHHFYNLGILHEEALKGSDQIVSENFGGTNVRAPQKKCNRYVITSLINNSDIDVQFVKALCNYCKEKDAQLKIIIIPDAKGNLNKETWRLHYPLIQEENILDPDEDLEITPSFIVSSLKLGIKTPEPLNVIQNLKVKNSIVIGSPKLRLRTLPYWDEPFYAMTTGTISENSYKSKTVVSARDLLAVSDHSISALYIEVVDEKVNFRQLIASGSGFVDYGTRYTPTTITQELPEAIVLGDWHSGHTSYVVEHSAKEVIKTLKPTYIVLHDLFDGTSINHHEEHKTLTKAQRVAQNKSNLKEEMGHVVNDLNKLSKLALNVVVTKSNHDLFLDNYLNEGKFINDYQNIEYASTLIPYKVANKNVLKCAVEELNGGVLKNVIWLDKLSSFKIGDIELGHHGNNGVNGAKSSFTSLEKLYDKAVIGHFHSSYIGRGIWSVGTLTSLRVGYNETGSTWSNSLILVYKDGTRQLINL